MYKIDFFTGMKCDLWKKCRFVECIQEKNLKSDFWQIFLPPPKTRTHLHVHKGDVHDDYDHVIDHDIDDDYDPGHDYIHDHDIDDDYDYHDDDHDHDDIYANFSPHSPPQPLLC